MCVQGHRNRSARNFVERQGVKCAFSVLARGPRQTEEFSNSHDSLTWTRSHRESNHSQDPPVQNLFFQQEEDDCTKDMPEGSTFGITRPASQTTPNEQHVKPSTIIGERCVPSRLKSAAEFEGSCVNMYTEKTQHGETTTERQHLHKRNSCRVREHQRTRIRKKTQICRAPFALSLVK